MQLEWRSATTTTLAINVYDAAPKHNANASANTGGTDYLTDSQTANDQALYQYSTSRGTATAGSPLTLSVLYSTFTQPTDKSSNIYLLFEGAGRGQGRLVVCIYQGTTKIAESAVGVDMDLKNIKELYERWTVGEGNGGTPSVPAQISGARLPYGVPVGLDYSASGDPGLSVPGDPQGNAYILFVHGWNMQPWEKDTFAETAFKRLYWQGYKGKFGAFQWPTTLFNSLKAYDNGEFTAWQAAVPLEAKLHDLSSQYIGVYVLAHSMGNVVVGEALRRAKQDGYGTVVNTYVATQAAVPGNCYDPNLTGSDLISGFGLIGGELPITPNIYNSWMAVNAAGKLANYYNINDYALSKWQIDQRTKPDNVAGDNSPYGYCGSLTAPPAPNGFFANYSPDNAFSSCGGTQLQLGNAANVLNRYEIMAFAAQPRSKALGGISNVAGFSPQNLATTAIWPADTYPQPSGPYSAHLWHSAQFEFTNAGMQGYWLALMVRFGMAPIVP